MHGSTRWRAASTAVLSVLALGCGEGRPAVSGSTTEVKALGIVRINGKPASGGTITFNPANYRRGSAMPRPAPIGTDGTYEVTTFVGENTVSVTGPEVANDPKLSVNQKLLDLRDGTNLLDIDVP